MNPSPNPSEPADPLDPRDEALLEEALAEPTPAELDAKILALTDPQTVSLLDEALAPEALPQGLNERILAATMRQARGAPRAGEAFPDQRTDQRTGQRAVLARLGPTTLRYAAAAAIALAVGLGVWFANRDAAVTNDTLATAVQTPAPTSDPLLDDEDAATQWLDSEFALADDLLGSGIDELTDSVDDLTISRDSIWSELEAYEQFLSDIESGDV